MSDTHISFADIERIVAQSPALPDQLDQRDFAAGHILRQVDLPASYSLRGQQSPVKNQGIRGTCSAFAIAAIAEYFNQTPDTHLDLSEEFMFKVTKEIDLRDYGYSGYGAYFRSAAKAYRTHGICHEATMPYRMQAAEDSWRTLQIPTHAHNEAWHYRAAYFARVAASDAAICQALVGSMAPLFVGCTLYASYRTGRETGYIPTPQPHDSRIGGHAVAIVGYTSTHYIMKNCWGPSWGDGGYCYWPRSAHEHLYAIWSFVDTTNLHIHPDALEDALHAKEASRNIL